MTEVAQVSMSVDSRGARAGAADFSRQMDRIVRSIDRVHRRTRQMERGMTDFGRTAQTSARSTAAFGGSLRSMLLLFGGFSIVRNAARDMVGYESALVDVAKTSDLSAEETAKLGDEIRGLTQSVAGLTADGLLEVAAVAGQLGIKGRRDILTFAEAMEMLRSSTSGKVAGEEGAQSMATLIGLLGEATSSVTMLGGVLTELGNTSKRNEAQILRTATEIARAGTSYRMAAVDAFGLATAFASTGTQAEVARTALLKTYDVLDNAVRDGGDVLEDIAGAAGMAADAFAELYSQNSTDAVVAFIKGIDNLNRAGENTGKWLDRLGLGDVRVKPSLMSLAASFDDLEKHMASARREATRGGQAMFDEVARKSETLDAKLTKLGESWKNLTREGSVFNRTLGNVTDGLSNYINILSGADPTIGLDRGRGIFASLVDPNEVGAEDLPRYVKSMKAKLDDINRRFESETIDPSEFDGVVKLRERMYIYLSKAQNSLRAIDATRPGQQGPELPTDIGPVDTLRFGGPSPQTQKLSTDYEAFLGQLRTAADIAGMSTNEQEKQLALLQAREVLQRKLTTDEEAEIRAAVAAQQKAAEALANTQELVGSTLSGIADGLFAMAEGTMTARQAIQRLLQDIARLIVQQQIAGLVSNVGSWGGGAPTTNAQGNAFMGGRVVPFATGGLPDQGFVNQRVIFPLRGGSQVGVAGEAGREGVARLKRMRNGDMGVAMEGGGRPVVQHITIQTQDVGSFNKSKGMVMRDLRKAVE